MVATLAAVPKAVPEASSAQPVVIFADRWIGHPVTAAELRTLGFTHVNHLSRLQLFTAVGTPMAVKRLKDRHHNEAFPVAKFEDYVAAVERDFGLLKKFTGA